MSKAPAAVYTPIDRIEPWDQNPRHNEGAVDAVARSIQEFGFATPIVAQASTSRIIAGHTRWKAAQKLGLETVPVRFLAVSDEQAVALAIADNRLGDIATWDETVLVDLLGGLADGGFDMSLLGFEDAELDAMLGTWEDPFEGMTKDPPGPLNDEGTVKVVATVPITWGQKAGAAVHEALAAIGLGEDDYKVRVA